MGIGTCDVCVTHIRERTHVHRIKKKTQNYHLIHFQEFRKLTGNKESG